MTVVSHTSESDIRNMVLDAYGKIEVYEREELEAMLTRDSDIKMDSAPAATIIAKIEKQIGRELPEPSDLRPEEFSSVNSIVSLIMRKIREGDGKPLKRTPIGTTIVAGQ
jgi:acyl carrier protein